MKAGLIQYTIRGVSKTVDRALRRRVREEQKSLNQVLLESVERGLGLEASPKVFRNLDFIVGTWVEDPEFDAALAEQDVVDEEQWR